MVKRDRRNIGKRVFTSLGVGTVKGFRGNDLDGIPFVKVWVDSHKAVYPFKGNQLRYVK